MQSYRTGNSHDGRGGFGPQTSQKRRHAVPCGMLARPDSSAIPGPSAASAAAFPAWAGPVLPWVSSLDRRVATVLVHRPRPTARRNFRCKTDPPCRARRSRPRQRGSRPDDSHFVGRNGSVRRAEIAGRLRRSESEFREGECSCGYAGGSHRQSPAVERRPPRSGNAFGIRAAESRTSGVSPSEPTTDTRSFRPARKPRLSRVHGGFGAMESEGSKHVGAALSGAKVPF
jgi:hypothetical protein